MESFYVYQIVQISKEGKKYLTTYDNKELAWKNLKSIANNELQVYAMLSISGVSIYEKPISVEYTNRNTICIYNDVVKDGNCIATYQINKIQVFKN